MQQVWKYRGRGSSGLGKEQTDAMINMQRELLAAYEQAGRSWLARAKYEVDLWSELAEKLSKTQSFQLEPIRNVSRSESRWLPTMDDDCSRKPNASAEDHATILRGRSEGKHLNARSRRAPRPYASMQ